MTKSQLINSMRELLNTLENESIKNDNMNSVLFDEYFDNNNDSIFIAGKEYSASSVLKQIDKKRYEEEKESYLEMMFIDDAKDRMIRLIQKS